LRGMKTGSPGSPVLGAPVSGQMAHSKRTKGWGKKGWAFGLQVKPRKKKRASNWKDSNRTPPQKVKKKVPRGQKIQNGGTCE